MKRKFVFAFLLLVLALNSFGANASEAKSDLCFSEKNTIMIMKKQVEAAEKEIDALRSNRRRSLTGDILSAVIGLSVIGVDELGDPRHSSRNYDTFKQPKGYKSPLRPYVVAALGAQTLTSVYNFKVSTDQINLFETMIRDLKAQINQRAADIEQGRCLMTKATTQISKSEKLSEAISGIAELNRILSEASNQMAIDLGNAGTRGSSTVSLGLNIISALAIFSRGYEVGAIAALAQIPTQMVDAGSLYLSRREAKQILELINKTIVELDKQERALKAILNAEGILE